MSDEAQTLTSENTPTYQVDDATSSGEDGTQTTEPAPQPDTDEPVAATPEETVYTIKVDGETREVTETELITGFQKGENYTRKTQELAEERKALRDKARLGEAWQADPQGTARILNAQLGWNISDGTSNPETDEYLSDEQKQIQQLQARIDAAEAAAENAQRQQNMDRQLSKVHEEFGDFDEEQVLQHAISNGIGTIRAAYLDMNADLIKKGSTVAQAESAKQAVIEAKKEAQIVSRTAPNAAGAGGNVVEQPSDVREAWLLATQGKEVTGSTLPDWVKNAG